MIQGCENTIGCAVCRNNKKCKMYKLFNESSSYAATEVWQSNNNWQNENAAISLKRNGELITLRK